MLFALGQPIVLLGLLLGYLAGMFAQYWTHRLILGGRRGLRGVTKPQLWLDPYSAVGALLGGMGWPPGQELDRRRVRLPVILLLASLGVEAVLAAIGLAAFRLAGGSFLSLDLISTVNVIHGNGLLGLLPQLQRLTLGFAVESLACGVICLVPIPPLPLGVWLWSALPRTAGARRFAYHLLEENWGILIVLVLLVIPLGGQEPLLLSLVGDVVDPILHAL
ncbi:MAG TPA: hypothetical protein VHW92_13745 [Mycobacteriales bacterium]|jgi:hypothetical protein|nr:hypothetical protein [Mycobacteriales bacterium]